MRPVLLKIAGLNSFLEEQEIDFSVLLQSGIFGIFGPTGSGKSSILDAVTLALYDKIARESNEFIHNDAETAMVSFRFALEKQEYMAERSYKRTKEGTYRTAAARLVDMTEPSSPVVLAEKATEVTKQVVGLLGLTYEDFVRSIVLPQGKFSEFLTLRGRDRRNMLERIFHLEAFGAAMLEKIRQAYGASKGKMEVLEAKLSIFEGVTPEVLKEYHLQLQEVEIFLQQTERMLTESRQEFEAGRALFEKVSELAECQTELDKLNGQKEEIEETKKRLERGRRAASGTVFYERMKKTEAAFQSALSACEEQEKRYKILEQEFERIEELYRNAEQDKQDKYPALLQKKEEARQAIGFLRELETLENERKALSDKYRVLRQGLRKEKDGEQKNTEACQRIKESLEQIEAEKKCLTVSIEYKAFIEKGVYAEKQIKELQAAAEEYQKELATISQRQKRQEARNGSLLAELEQAEKQVEKWKKEIQVLIEKQGKKQAADLAELLEDGCPCPVCGALHHPCPAVRQETEDVLENQDILTEKLNKAEACLADKRQAHAVLTGEMRVGCEQKMRAEKQLAETEKKLAAIKEALCVCPEGTETVESFEKEWERLRTLEGQKESLFEKERKLRLEWETLRKEKESLQETIQKKELMLAAIEAQGKEKKEAVEEKRKKVLLYGGENPEKAFEVLENSILQMTEKMENAKKAWESASAKKQQEHSRMLQFFEQQKGLQSQLKEQEADFLTMCEKAGFISGDDWKQNLLSEETLEGMEKECHTYDKKRMELTAAAERLSAAIGGRRLLQEELAELEKKYLVFAEEKEQAQKKQAVLTQKAAELTESLKKVALLERQREKEQHIFSMLTDLMQLMKGNRFISFLASRELTYITKEASKRLLKMTKGRYTLQLAEGEFVIADNFNGGVCRKPNTLSGGEVFLTSLALALALSSKIQLKNRAPLQFFFLDEGFGTLDASLLDTVMTALTELKNDALSVGIITHVELLKERMPVKLMVYPAVQGVCGTKVKIEYA